MVDINREIFINRAYDSIKRGGISELIDELSNTDFFVAPASTRFHGAYEGGLCEHSLNVYERLKDINDFHGSIYPRESIALCGLFHDICKTNLYKTEYRNVKNEKTGTWEKAPYYTVEDKFPYGHGEKSVYIISKFIRLTDEEAIAIRWHMGGYDEAVKGGSYAQSQAYDQYPLALYLHMADMEATHINETKKTDEINF